MDVITLIPPSTLVNSTLEPIPQSTAPTPSYRESPSNEAGPSVHTPSRLPTPDDFAGYSRRSSTSSYLSVTGSYFPAASSSQIFYTPSSGATTPSERPRPSPLELPSGAPDDPIFSAYPDTGSTPTSAKGKGRAFNLILKPALNLSTTHVRRKRSDAEDGSADEWKMPLTHHPRIGEQSASHPHRVRSTFRGQSSTRPTSPNSQKSGRRRAATVSHSPTEEVNQDSARDSELEDRLPPRNTLATRTSSSSIKGKSFRAFRKRRASLGSVFSSSDLEYDPPGTKPHWPSMVAQVAQRFEPNPSVPFTYRHPGNSENTLQSVSTVTTVRPLASPKPALTAAIGLPSISPRKSSLNRGAANDGVTILGLSNVSAMEGAGSAVEIVMPDDMAMPHEPPPRRSSLDYPRGVLFDDNDISAHGEEPSPPIHHDGQSIISASLTGTDTSASASADAFSPASSQEHPLSSATTSLSRSAKSGKEGTDEKDAALTALRLQRSLEWEARQTRHRRRLEKRKMILLELVETEVAYTEGLKTLSHVYLPQLAALPMVTERTAKKIARNTEDLYGFHAAFVGKMVEVLKSERVGYGYGQTEELDIAGKVDSVSKRIAALFIDNSATFALYREFCAESIVASTLVRHISNRADYDAFEKRCQIIGAAQPHITLYDLLGEPRSPGPHTRSRLHFKDYLIMPIQRICRYPLLLNQLLDSTGQTSPTVEEDEFDDECYDVGIDVERALGVMRGVAEEADEARRLKDTEVKSATVLERLEPHPMLTQTFLRSLGTCRLIGSLDVLHHHPTVAPLMPPVKVKYLAAILYRGYLILAKVKKAKVYEAKHFLPLEVFELIDITEGFLPHSIRLRLREHNFDLAASCEAEKEVWAAAICEARDECTVPPFELPASVSPFPVSTRRVSTAVSVDLDHAAITLANKRHTLTGLPDELAELPDMPSVASPEQKPSTPLVSPTRSSFGFTPDRKPGQPGTILLRRASNNQRMLVDRGLVDVFSDSCSTARSKAQLNHMLFLPDVPPSELRDRMSIRESTMLRRRKSFLDSRATSFDIAFTGEIKGSVIQVRPSRSQAAKYRSLPAQRKRGASISSTRGLEAESGDDESATATGNSDFGTLRRDFTRSNSVASFSPAPTPRRSYSSLRDSIDEGLTMRFSQRTRDHSLPAPSKRSLDKSRRPPGAIYDLPSKPHFAYRAKSMPVSPMLSPSHEGPGGTESGAMAPTGKPTPPPLVQKSASDHSPSKAPQGGVAAGEYFIPPPHGSPLGTIGTNVVLSTSQASSFIPDRMSGQTQTPATTWGTLRRSMSFLPLKSRGSVTSMEEALTGSASTLGSGSGSGSGSASASASGSGSGSGSGTAPGSGSGSAAASASASVDGGLHLTDDGTGSGAVTGGVPDDGDAPLGFGVGNGGGSVPNTPRRKRSLRMFGFKGFTPI
ncbi:hypothetical protein IAR55_006654 [Kwoniella newhampshirensis]|uniref:DH domain-containing protein n=1 Tax=Kwoniella newhampshirensis TaxID=1651941 RepID=A0AAW0YES0_9TREE